VSEVPYGVRVLSELYKEWASAGMVGYIGARILEISTGSLALEADMKADQHGFPTARGEIVHGGAIATLADEAMASVAFTVAEEGETTATSSLQVDYYQPAALGRLVARAVVRRRTKRLAYCHATVEQHDGKVVAEARAVIAYIRERP
jgi:uncharacterized protein (TIGR00369 family)